MVIQRRRITVLCQGVPFPANHGGKVDAWNLIRGMQALGAEVQLVYWVAPGGEQVSPEILSTSPASIELQRRQGIWRLLRAKYPPRMVSFTPDRDGWKKLLTGVRSFDPDWIFLDSWIGFLTGRELSRELDRPLAYRSQNVEHVYFRDLLRVARGSLRLRIGANAIRMKWVERLIRREADLVLDISADDARHWGDTLAPNVEILPPLWIDDFPETDGPVDIDVLFVGNLHTPNNVEGLDWFTREVLPVLKVANPACRIVFAGAAPSAEDQARWESSGIICIPNPPEPRALYSRARVVANPQRRGSGVPLKMLEVLASGRPVVATSVGTKGLPSSARAQVTVADSPLDFGAAVTLVWASGGSVVSPHERRSLMDQCFGLDNVRRLFLRMDRITASRKSDPPVEL